MYVICRVSSQVELLMNFSIIIEPKKKKKKNVLNNDEKNESFPWLAVHKSYRVDWSGS